MSNPLVLRRTATVLDVLSRGASAASPFLPGTAGTVASAISAALGLGADIAAVGLDPVTTIEKAKSSGDALGEMRARWAAKRRAATGG